MKFRNFRLNGLVNKRMGMGAVALAGLMSVGGLSLATSSPTVETIRTEVRDAFIPGPAAATKTERGWDLANIDHDRVDYWIDRFRGDPDMREKFEGFVRRSGWYGEMIRAKLREREMPEDLLYLAMIESGFQPHAYSPARASGLWQFVAETGKRYGLRVDGVVDERNDPEKATDAALDYLQEMHDRFGSWYLAAAGYNTGENRVARIMRERTGSEQGSDEDYYKIWDELPSETRDYVPLMIAVARIDKDKELYGFEDVEPDPTLEYEVTVTDAGFTLETVAKVSGAELSDLKLLNPHLKKGQLPRNERFELRLPVGTRTAFEQNWASALVLERKNAAAAKRATTAAAVVRYKVRRGDNLSTIARRHGMTVAQLRRVNGLRTSRIYAGQVLKVDAD
jgi:membrane-bound lytic murein transglycosylase D